MENKLKLIVTEGEIREAVAKVASAIQRDFKGETPVLIGVLKGSFVFINFSITICYCPWHIFLPSIVVIGHLSGFCFPALEK